MRDSSLATASKSMWRTVVVLDHRMQDQIATRRLRVLKYRGSSHATNEFLFIIADDGVSVLPITTLGLKHEASRERVSTGIAELDEMMGGKGYCRSTSVFVTGTAGTGKTSIASSFIEAACKRGEKCIYLKRRWRQCRLSLRPRNWRPSGLSPTPKPDRLHWQETLRMRTEG